MSNLNNKTSQYKSEIKEAFKSLEPGNNGIIETNQLNELNKIKDLNKKNPFLSDTIKSLISKKNEENDEYISSKEFISFVDEQLSGNNSKEDIEKIFNIFCEENKESFSWTKFAMTMKELGENDTANKLLKLIEQSKLYNKDINLDEFYDIINEEYEDNNIKSSNEGESYKQKEKYKHKKKDANEEEEDIKTISSKNEDNKKSMEDNEMDKTNKRYHRRYRDTKNKNENKIENNDNINNVNSSNNKIHTKYRKKK